MAKKLVDDDDDFENENENEKEFDDNFIDDDSDSDDDSDGEFTIDLDSDDDLDIIIEIDEDELDIIDKPEEPSEDDVILSKHKIEGKHSLKYDSIFKGKREEPASEDDPDSFSSYFKETIEVDKSSMYHHESMDNESYVRGKLVKERVYEVLKEHTSINFLNNRRKPSKVDFNSYYGLIKTHLKDESFTNIELFNELAVYFSDNIFNMFKLLDPKWRNLMLTELEEHIGKSKNSKDVTNRNIYEGTEIEFIWIDEFEDEKLITGVVIETDYETSTFKIDSYENIYNVHLDDITKILNNTKFKYNLNKLNNIDFL
jgi:hypothetical protein